jgi:hypothetical protein
MVVSALIVAFVPGRGGYAVGWGTLALINAALAQDRRCSGLVGFLLSLLVGRSPRCCSSCCPVRRAPTEKLQPRIRPQFLTSGRRPL